MKTRFLPAALLLLHLGAGAQTGTISRLVATGRDAYLNGAMAPVDSTQYFTSGNNICDLELGYQNDSSYLFSYDAGNSGFRLTGRTVHTLCPEGYLTTLDQKAVAPHTPLQNTFTHRYGYLPGGAVMDTLLSWNDTTNKWDYLQLCADTFRDAKHLRVHYYGTWDGSGWAQSAKTEHRYTSSGDPDSIIDLNKDPGTGAWLPAFLMKYRYDALNRLVGETYYTWKNAGAAWLPLMQTTTTYNAVGDTALLQSFQWDTSSSSWTMIMRHIVSYNTAHKPVCDIQQFFVGGTNGFLNWSRTQYTYNRYGQATSMSTERWNIQRSAFEYGPQSGRERYHYEE